MPDPFVDPPQYDIVDVTVYYLEMLAPPTRMPDANAGLQVTHLPAPDLAWYRRVYHDVGHNHRWLSRRRMPDGELLAILQDPGVEVHVAQVEGELAGFAELDSRVAGDIELVQFGLLPKFLGQGLGKSFLSRIVDLAWKRNPRRVWLHTCSFDHPAALPTYLKAGFQETRRESIRREY